MEDKKKRLGELKEEMCKMYELMKRCGNKNPKEHYIIKDYIREIKALEADIYE